VEEQGRLNGYIEEITGEINEIGARLKDVRTRQVTISTLVPAAETDAKLKTAIMNDIAALENQLDADKRSINELEQKMKKSTVRIAALEKMVAGLKKDIEENQKTIAALTQTVHLKDEEIAAARQSLENTQSSLSTTENKLNEKEQELEDTRNTAFYAVGTAKELQQKNVIDRFGLFSKKSVLTADFDPATFVKVDKSHVSDFEIQCGVKDVQVVPQRTAGSYSLQEISKDKTLLKVVNQDEFWKVPYLVVVMD
ncbi:MAG TPA: hypothetical protein VJ417_03460, partial [Candidatus Glassbacteria bacterium]|nr:hypothetical protein [Candidatus Glassbacteria bacterium]